MHLKKYIRSARLTIFVILSLLLFISTSAGAFAFSAGNIIGGINAQRSAVGVGGLAYNQQLTIAATAKAQHMCTYNYWAHTAPDGTTGWTFIKQTGYAYTAAGENLAKGFLTDADVIAGWMASATHRTTMLNATYKDVGVGYNQCGPAVTDTIIVALFAAPVAKPAPAPAPAPKPTPAPAPKPTTPAPTVSKSASTTTTPAPQPTPATTPQPQPATDTIKVTATVLPTPFNTPSAAQPISTQPPQKSLLDKIVDFVAKALTTDLASLFKESTVIKH